MKFEFKKRSTPPRFTVRFSPTIFRHQRLRYTANHAHFDRCSFPDMENKINRTAGNHTIDYFRNAKRPSAEKPSASSTLVVRWVPNRNWLEIVPFEFPFIRHRQEISNPVAIIRNKTRNKYTCNLLAQTDRGESIFRTACCYIIHVCSFRWCLFVLAEGHRPTKQ